MTSPVLVREFARISEASTAMPSLRRLIFDLAAHGRLSIDSVADATPVTSELGPGVVNQLTGRMKASLEPISLPRPVPTTWRYVALTDLARVTYGFAFPSSQFNQAKLGMPLLRIRDIDALDTQVYFDGEWDPNYVVRAGDYLVGMDGDFNLRRWQGPDALLNQRVMRLNSWSPSAVPEFVVIGLQIVLDRLHETTSQTTVKHLSAQQVRSIRVPIPPTIDQERIVAKVEELKAMCDELELAHETREQVRDAASVAALRMLTGATDDASTDASTIRRRVHFYTRNIRRLITRPEHIAELRQALLKLAVRGWLTDSGAASHSLEAAESESQPRQDAFPLRWRRILFSDAALISGGFAFKSEDYAPSGVFVLRVTNIAADSSVSRNDGVYLAPDKVSAKLESYYLEVGEILVVMVGGSLGKIGVVSRDVLPALLNQNLWRITPAGDHVDHEFLRILVKFIVAFQPRITQSTHGHYSREEFRSIPIALPPLAEQQQIAMKFNHLMAICDEVQTSLETVRTHNGRFLEATLEACLAPGFDGPRQTISA